MPLAKWAGLQIGPIVLWAMLILLTRRALAFYPRFEGSAPAAAAGHGEVAMTQIALDPREAL
jgi:hypothetical protein